MCSITRRGYTIYLLRGIIRGFTMRVNMGSCTHFFIMKHDVVVDLLGFRGSDRVQKKGMVDENIIVGEIRIPQVWKSESPKVRNIISDPHVLRLFLDRGVQKNCVVSTWGS